MREIADIGYRPVVGVGYHCQQASPGLPTDGPSSRCPPPRAAAAAGLVMLGVLFAQLVLVPWLVLCFLTFLRDFPEVDLLGGRTRFPRQP